MKSLSFADPELISAFADAAGPTVQWLKTFGVSFDFLPTQFLTKSQPRLLPIGGGLALVEALAAAAEKRGATFLLRDHRHGLHAGRTRRGRRRACSRPTRRSRSSFMRQQSCSAAAASKATPKC